MLGVLLLLSVLDVGCESMGIPARYYHFPPSVAPGYHMGSPLGRPPGAYSYQLPLYPLGRLPRVHHQYVLPSGPLGFPPGMHWHILPGLPTRAPQNVDSNTIANNLIHPPANRVVGLPAGTLPGLPAGMPSPPLDNFSDSSCPADTVCKLKEACSVDPAVLTKLLPCNLEEYKVCCPQERPTDRRLPEAYDEAEVQEEHERCRCPEKGVYENGTVTGRDVFKELEKLELKEKLKERVDYGSCGHATSDTLSLFGSPYYPTVVTGLHDCTFQVKIKHKKVRQIRIDFQDVKLAQPTERGECSERNRLTISVSESHYLAVKEFCGVLTNQHAYIHLSQRDAGAGKLGNTVTLKVNVSGSEVDELKWKIRVLQVTSRLAAPSGCFQYFPQRNGHFSSFNFDPSDPSSRGYFNGLHYSVCLRRPPDVCRVYYMIDHKKGQSRKLWSGTQCSGDYLDTGDISLSTEKGAINRYCKLDGVTADSLIAKGFPRGPLTIHFHSDGDVSNNDCEFNIRYRMSSSCT